MKYNFLLLFSLLYTFTFAQIKMEGVIVDSLNVPLESASIV